MGTTPRNDTEAATTNLAGATGAGESTADLLRQRRALVADLRTAGGDRLTRATIEAQIKMIDAKITGSRS